MKKVISVVLSAVMALGLPPAAVRQVLYPRSLLPLRHRSPLPRP